MISSNVESLEPRFASLSLVVLEIDIVVTFAISLITKTYHIRFRGVSTRLGMKIELERSVMDGFVRSYVQFGLQHVRFNQIARMSEVGKSTLQRILPRLVNRGWIEKQRKYSWSDGRIGSRLYNIHFINDSESKGNHFVIKEMKKDLEEKLEENESYRNIVNYGVHPKTKEKMVRKGTIPSLKPGFDKVLAGHLPTEHTFYRLIEYPFYFRRPALENVQEQKSIEWACPKGTKRYWRRSAKNIFKEVGIFRNNSIDSSSKKQMKSMKN